MRQNKYSTLRFPLVLLQLAWSMLSWHGVQAQFISAGRIEFERKTNQLAFLDENNTWDQLAKNSLSKFVTYYFDLHFTAKRSVYKAGRDPDVPQNKYWGVFDADNTVFHDLDSNLAIIQKSIYSDIYLIRDSIRKIDWKIGSEMRTIAGFNCRKAVGKVFDSIVVIAFYSEEIIPSAGPESFAGLPGMILGVAIPKLHTTWYATKIVATDPTPANIAVPKKGKKIAATEFAQRLRDILKGWGSDAGKREWQLLL